MPPHRRPHAPTARQHAKRSQATRATMHVAAAAGSADSRGSSQQTLGTRTAREALRLRQLGNQWARPGWDGKVPRGETKQFLFAPKAGKQNQSAVVLPTANIPTLQLLLCLAA